jgi:anti-sigma B factor antagonist
MKVAKHKGIAVVAPSGWLMGGPETDDFEKTIRDLLESGNRCLVIDLIECNHMNSIALGKLIGMHTSYANRGGRMKLCNLDKRIQNVLIITKLSLVFDVYQSEREAMASFAGTECPG